MKNKGGESKFAWLFDVNASTDMIDLYFVASGNEDIHQTDEQIAESAMGDALAVKTAQQGQRRGRKKPIGKLVL